MAQHKSFNHKSRHLPGSFLIFGDDDSLVLAYRTFPLPPFTSGFRREYIPALEQDSWQ